MLFLIKKSFKVVLGVIASIAIAALATFGIMKCKDKRIINNFVRTHNSNLTPAEQFKEKYGKNGELPKSVLKTIYNHHRNKMKASKDEKKYIKNEIAEKKRKLKKKKTEPDNRQKMENKLKKQESDLK